MAKKGRPKLEHAKSAKTSIRMYEEQMTRLSSYAEASGLTKDAIINIAIEKFLNEQEKNKEVAL